jgi:hypothetical protein
VFGFSLAHFAYGIGVECLISMITGVELEKVVAPVIVAIGSLEILVSGHGHMFGAD